VLADATTDMVILEEETFGPVAPLYRFKSNDEAVRMANDAPTLPSPLAGRVREGARRLFLQPRHRPHLARRRGARIRHRSRSNTSAWAASTGNYRPRRAGISDTLKHKFWLIRPNPRR
jgi:hypothetical protein